MTGQRTAGAPVEPQRLSRATRLVLCAGASMLLALGVYLVFVRGGSSDGGATSHSPPGTSRPVALARSPLAALHFASRPVPYPVGWPHDLRYPPPFKLVGAAAGKVRGDGRGWSAKMLYDRNPKTAASALTAFFVARGWTLDRRDTLKGAGYTLMLTGSQRRSAAALVARKRGQKAATAVVVTVLRAGRAK